jgi:transcriptional regulator with XRE-family HTH domain
MPDKRAVSIGYQIRAARLAAGMSQADVELKSGIPKARLSRYENNHVMPSLQPSPESLRDLLLQLSSSARDKLRSVLIRDDRDEIAQLLLRYGDANGDGWADVIDTLSMYPDARRRVVRLLAEMDAT